MGLWLPGVEHEEHRRLLRPAPRVEDYFVKADEYPSAFSGDPYAIAIDSDELLNRLLDRLCGHGLAHRGGGERDELVARLDLHQIVEPDVPSRGLPVDEPGEVVGQGRAGALTGLPPRHPRGVELDGLFWPSTSTTIVMTCVISTALV
jgi:hypothetical protein